MLGSVTCVSVDPGPDCVSRSRQLHGEHQSRFTRLPVREHYLAAWTHPHPSPLLFPCPCHPPLAAKANIPVLTSWLLLQVRPNQAVLQLCHAAATSIYLVSRSAAEHCCVGMHAASCAMGGPPAPPAPAPVLPSVCMASARANAPTCVRPVQSPAPGTASTRYSTCCHGHMPCLASPCIYGLLPDPD